MRVEGGSVATKGGLVHILYMSIKHYKSIKFVGHGKYENNLLYSFKFYMLIYNDKNAARKGLQKITLYLVSGSWKSVSTSSGMIHD